MLGIAVLGCGRVGQHIAQMAEGLGMIVRAYDPFLARSGWPDGSALPVGSAQNILDYFAGRIASELVVNRAVLGSKVGA